MGDKVARGEPILEVQTDKVDVEVESYADGYLRKTLVAEGEMAGALEPVAILTDTPNEEYRLEPASKSTAVTEDAEGTPDPKPAGLDSRPAARAAAAPAARRLAAQLGIDLREVPGTGPDGLIIRKDVEAFAVPPQSAHKLGEATARALSAMAETTLKSKREIPHFYVTRELDVEAACEWRAGWNEKHPEAKATLNDLFVWAAAKALRDVPRMNVALRNESYEQRGATDVLLVVARNERLSLTPIADPCNVPWPVYLGWMRQAERVSSAPTATEAQALDRPALAVSNLGMHNVDSFAAIIPPGCTAILAIGSATPRPVVDRGKVLIRRRCSVTMSADHRIVDGVTAARFLERMEFHLASKLG